KVTEEDLEPGSGKTPKFKCRLMAKDPKTGKIELVLDENQESDDIKVKYTTAANTAKAKYNPEVFAEVVGTRLLWALGFGADRMFAVKRVHCFGCTADPHKDMRIDETTLIEPRLFELAAIEKKAKGTEITGPKGEEGWEFSEAMAIFSADPSEGHYQYKHRDALRLLMSIFQHTDNKAENQRMLCLDKPAPATAEECQKVQLIVQDIGTSLGVGLVGFSINKFDLKKWAPKPVWGSDVAGCSPNYGTTMDSSVKKSISEYGRSHLAKLLAGFIKDRSRVEALFVAANTGLRKDESGDVKAWTDAFIAKAQQVIEPISGQSSFQCKM
ncbi:MAG: hypothetical protein V4692_04620, partial [Bdellovibrionota bacterium]